MAESLCTEVCIILYLEKQGGVSIPGRRTARAQTLSSDTAPLRGSKEASVAEGKTEGMAGEVGRGRLCRAWRMVEGPGFLWNNMGTLQRVLGRREALIH